MHYILDSKIATQYNVNVAIFLQNIAFWTKTNRANDHHFYDGYYWTYNTVLAFSELFPFWTVQQIRTIIKYCLDAGLLMKGKYNKNKYDHTLWYALTDKGLEIFDLPKSTNQIAENNKPIPDINTDIKKAFKSSCASDDANAHDQSFIEFWKAYPVKKDKQRTWRIWKKQKLALQKEEIIKALENFKTNDRKWIEGFIPHPSTFLKNERWLDEIEKPNPNIIKNNDENLPPKESIAQELVRFQNTLECIHPIVFLLYEKIGSWAVRSASNFDIERMINTNYKQACQEYHNNKESVQERINYYLEHRVFMPKLAEEDNSISIRANCIDYN